MHLQSLKLLCPTVLEEMHLEEIFYLDQGQVGIKPGFYHNAQHGGFYGFYEGGFYGVYGFYVGFINLKVYHNSHNQLLPYSFPVLLVLV